MIDEENCLKKYKISNCIELYRNTSKFAELQDQKNNIQYK